MRGKKISQGGCGHGVAVSVLSCCPSLSDSLSFSVGAKLLATPAACMGLSLSLSATVVRNVSARSSTHNYLFCHVSMLFNRLLCLVFRPFVPTCVSAWARAWHVAHTTPSIHHQYLSTFSVYLSSSLQLNHVQVVEGHKMPVAAENVHVALGVDDTNVAVTSGGLSSANEAKFVFT